MSVKRREMFTTEKKIVILKKHLLKRKAVSDICDEHGVHLTMFYRLQDKFFLDGTSIFTKTKQKAKCSDFQRLTQLEDKLQHKNEALSKLMKENNAS